MTEQPLSKAGSAILWKTIQHFGAKGIFLLRLVVLARILAPEDFGLLAIASVAIEVLVRITNFGMVPALIQKADVRQEHYDVAWTVGIVRALAISLITIITAPLFAQFFAEPRAVNIIRAIALWPVVDAAASIKVAELTRRLQFRSLAFVNLPKALANTLISILLAPSLGVWALVAGAIAGPIAYLVASYILAPHRPRFSLNRAAGRALISYGRWVFLTGLAAMAGQSALKAVISRELGADQLGLYYLAASIAFLPAELASHIVGEVSFPLYARLQSDLRQTARAFTSLLSALLAVLVPLLTLLIVLAPRLVDSVLGAGWAGTAPLIRVLAMAAIIGVLGEAVGPILQGTGRPDRILVIESVQSLMLVLLAKMLSARFGVTGAAAAWIPAVAASQLIAIAYLGRTLGRPFVGLGRRLAILAAISLLIALATALTAATIPGLPGLIVAGLLGLLLAGGLLWYIEQRFAAGFSTAFVIAFPAIGAALRLSKEPGAELGSSSV